MRVKYIIRFGGYEWRVLDVRNGKVLLLRNKIIEKKPYRNEYEYITWETCGLRKCLNSEFYNTSSEVEKSRIARTTVVYDDNCGSAYAAAKRQMIKYFVKP